MMISKINIRFGILLLLCACFYSAGAQEDTTANRPRQRQTPERPPLGEKLFGGGSLSLGFGTVTLVEVSPYIGYRLTERLGVGVGTTYIYHRIRYQNTDYASSIFGGRLFGRYLIIENFFTHAEYEALLFRNKAFPMNDYLIESFLLGGGLRQNIGGNFYSNLVILYNVLHEPGQSVFYSPLVIRGGISVGF